jgi:hypothetical protein
LNAEEHVIKLEEGQHVFIDPARRDRQQNKIILLEDCSPNVTQLISVLRAKKCTVLVKLSPLLDIHQLITQLYPSDVYILSVNNECRELLGLIQPDPSENSLIHTHDLSPESTTSFSFQIDEEATAKIDYGDPESYLYMPNASIMKSGAFKLIGNTFGLNKLAPNTHLYTSSSKVDDFPGRVYRIVKVGLSSKDLARNYKGTNLNVIARNYPLNSSQITEKYGLIESGNLYLFAITNNRNKKLMILAERC